MCRLCRLPERPRLGRLPRSTSWPGDLQRFFSDKQGLFQTDLGWRYSHHSGWLVGGLEDDFLHEIYFPQLGWWSNLTWIIFFRGIYHQLVFRYMTGWWFGTWLLFFHFIYGMSSFPLTHSIIFQRGRSTTNQMSRGDRPQSRWDVCSSSHRCQECPVHRRLRKLAKVAYPGWDIIGLIYGSNRHPMAMIRCRFFKWYGGIWSDHKQHTVIQELI